MFVSGIEINKLNTSTLLIKKQTQWVCGIHAEQLPARQQDHSSERKTDVLCSLLCHRIYVMLCFGFLFCMNLFFPLGLQQMIIVNQAHKPPERPSDHRWCRSGDGKQQEILGGFLMDTTELAKEASQQTPPASPLGASPCGSAPARCVARSPSSVL